jgi:glutamine amidotransferase
LSSLVIIKYNAGNIQSVVFALERIGLKAEVTDDIQTIQSADKVIFPGVGEASSAMKYLKERRLDEVIKELRQPVLGICLGMQLMCNHSEENDTDCIGIFDEEVVLFSPPVGGKDGIKVPQIGWNNIYNFRSGLFSGVQENSFVYLVHSYYAAIGKDTIATTNYITPYSAALQKNNFYGVQFHPEKSANVGEQILKNFMLNAMV